MSILVDFGGTQAVLSDVGGKYTWSCSDTLLEGVLNAYIEYTPKDKLVKSKDIVNYAITKIKPGVIINGE